MLLNTLTYTLYVVRENIERMNIALEKKTLPIEYGRQQQLTITRILLVCRSMPRGLAPPDECDIEHVSSADDTPARTNAFKTLSQRVLTPA